jgi:hypothetical protein
VLSPREQGPNSSKHRSSLASEAGLRFFFALIPAVLAIEPRASREDEGVKCLRRTIDNLAIN